MNICQVFFMIFINSFLTKNTWLVNIQAPLIFSPFIVNQIKKVFIVNSLLININSGNR